MLVLLLKISVAPESSQFEYQCTELQQLQVTGDMLVSALKDRILQCLKEANLVPSSHSVAHIRLRDRHFGRPEKPLRDTQTLAQAKLHTEGKELCYQILDEPEQLADGDDQDQIVLTQRWHRSDWSLGECHELYLCGSMSLRQVNALLSEVWGITVNNLRTLIVYPNTTVKLSSLHEPQPHLSLEGWRDLSTEGTLLKHFYKLHHGDLWLVQDVSESLPAFASSSASPSLEDVKGSSFGGGTGLSLPKGIQRARPFLSDLGRSKAVRASYNSGIKIRIHKQQSDQPSPTNDADDSSSPVVEPQPASEQQV